jgi:hypothetical protein
MKCMGKLTQNILSTADYGQNVSGVFHPDFTDEEFFEHLDWLRDQGYLQARRAPGLGVLEGWQITGITTKGKEFLRRLGPAHN